jgi:Fe-S-cluster containining protein
VSHCQSCGACCANYRVSFPCREVDDQAGGWVPIALVEESTPQVVCMRGTAAAPARCIALRGTIGESVSCAIYEFRPSACRDFAPLAAAGRGDEACNDARRRHGMAPLAMNPA